METGYGHEEVSALISCSCDRPRCSSHVTFFGKLESMSLALDTALNDHFKARPYHSDKRFHSSFMTTSNSASSAIASKGEDPSSLSITEPESELEWLPSKLPDSRVAELEKLAEKLNSKYGAELRALPPFKLPQLGIRVGNRVTWVQLP